MNSDDEPRGDRADDMRLQEPLADELLSAYVDGELTGPELAGVELRLQQDAEARRWVAEARTLSSLMQSLPRGRLSPKLRAQVLRRVSEERLSSEWKQPAGRELSGTSPGMARSYGGVRRWFWSGLAIAAALLLMFLQQGQPEVERRVADAQPEQDARKRSGGYEPKALASGDGGARQKPRTRWGFAAKPVPPVASAKVSEERMAAEASEPGTLAPMSPGQEGAFGGRSLARSGLDKPYSSTQSDLPARDSLSLSGREEPELVVQVVLHDPQRDRQWFLQLLSEHGMKPRKAGRSGRMMESFFAESVDPGQHATRGRRSEASSGGLVETVVVRTLPERLHGLLQACRTDPEHRATVVRMPSEDESLAELPARASGAKGAVAKARLDPQRPDQQLARGKRRRSLPDAATGAAQSAQGLVRVRFELRTTAATPTEESGEQRAESGEQRE